MEEGAVEKAHSPSLMISEYEGVFHSGDSTLIYNWIDNETGDRHLPIDVKETEWLTDQSYLNANEEESPE